eukprot:18809-Heterococcus_DN1.PRE.4
MITGNAVDEDTTAECYKPVASGLAVGYTLVPIVTAALCVALTRASNKYFCLYTMARQDTLDHDANKHHIELIRDYTECAVVCSLSELVRRCHNSSTTTSYGKSNARIVQLSLVAAAAIISVTLLQYGAAHGVLCVCITAVISRVVLGCSSSDSTSKSQAASKCTTTTSSIRQGEALMLSQAIALWSCDAVSIIAKMLGYDASSTRFDMLPCIHTRSPAAMVSQAGILGTLLIVYFTALAVNK